MAKHNLEETQAITQSTYVEKPILPIATNNDINYQQILESQGFDFGKPVKTHTVVKGDNLWNIAKANKISLNELRKLNPQIKGDILHTGDVLNLEHKVTKRPIDIVKEEEQEKEYNKSNLSAIQHAPHDSNYVVVDKKNKLLSIYDKDNNLLYQTDEISTGRDGGDYNTVTYRGRGSLENYSGNNSTPAGILTISSIGNYHDAPSFQRSRYNPETGQPYQVHPWVKQKDGSYKQDKTRFVNDDVASSFHEGNVSKARSSNGCVRISKKSLTEMSNYLGVGDKTYTLPEDDNSRFVLRGGKLNFVADNPYGNTEKGKDISATGKDKVNWDDYNVHVDKSYSPLLIVPQNKTGDEEYDTNVQDYANTISTNKETLQKKFNLSSYEYNKLAQLAMGIAQQESEFGTGSSLNPQHNYKLKTAVPGLVSVAKAIKRSLKDGSNVFTNIAADKDAISRGYGQIKMNSDNKELQTIYQALGIDEKSILSAKSSAIAVMARLAYMYNTEIRGKSFKGEGDKDVDKFDALLYKWNGKNRELKNKTATPDKNRYIRNVKSYMKDYKYFESRTSTK